MIRALRDLIPQAVPLIADQKGAAFSVILLIICILSFQVRRIYPKPRSLQFPDSPGEVLSIEEGNPEHRSHGGTDHLRIININAVPAHNDPGHSRSLRCAEDRAEITRILQVVKHKDVGLRRLPAEDLLHPVLFSLHDRQDPLGSLRVRDMGEYSIGKDLHLCPALDLRQFFLMFFRVSF